MLLMPKISSPENVSHVHFAVFGLSMCIYCHFLIEKNRDYTTLNISAPILDRLLPTCHYSQKIRDNVARPDSKVHYDLAS